MSSAPPPPPPPWGSLVVVGVDHGAEPARSVEHVIDLRAVRAELEGAGRSKADIESSVERLTTEFEQLNGGGPADEPVGIGVAAGEDFGELVCEVLDAWFSVRAELLDLAAGSPAVERLVAALDRLDELDRASAQLELDEDCDGLEEGDPDRSEPCPECRGDPFDREGCNECGGSGRVPCG